MTNKCEAHRGFSLLISSVQRMKKKLASSKKIDFVHISSEILILYKCLIAFRSLLSIPFPHYLRRKELKLLQIYCFLPKKEAQKVVNFCSFCQFLEEFFAAARNLLTKIPTCCVLLINALPAMDPTAHILL